MAPILTHKATFLARWPGVESQFPGAELKWGKVDDAGFAELKCSQAPAMIHATGAPVPVESVVKHQRTPHGWPPRGVVTGESGVTVEEPLAEDEISAAPKPKRKSRAKKKAAA